MKLEELQPKTTVSGILPDGPITVVSAQWYGADALELTYKTVDGRVGSQLAVAKVTSAISAVT